MLPYAASDAETGGKGREGREKEGETHGLDVEVQRDERVDEDLQQCIPCVNNVAGGV